jgi:membrane peptidoglycan carboxypeptidase
MSNILSDNSARELTFGASNGLIIPNYQVAVKTGTTNDKKDNWAIGWTPNLLTVAWVGNNDNSPMLKVASGVSGATPIWRRIMLLTLPKRPKVDFPIPEKIVSLEVDRVSGYASHDGFAARTDYFIDGTQPKVSDPIHLKLKVCRGVSGLATPQDVATGNYDEKEYVRLKEDDPVSKDGRNRWQEGIDSWIASQSDKDRYSPPEGYCRSDGMLDVGIDSPAHESTVGSTFEVRIKTVSLKRIVEVKLWVDGVERKTWNEKPYEMSLTLTDGPHTIKVKATDKDGSSTEREAKVGVNTPWNGIQPTATLAPTATPLPQATATTVPTVAPTNTVVPSQNP